MNNQEKNLIKYLRLLKRLNVFDVVIQNNLYIAKYNWYNPCTYLVYIIDLFGLVLFKNSNVDKLKLSKMLEKLYIENLK